MIQFLKDDIVASNEGTALDDIVIDDVKNWKKLVSIEIGMTAKTFLSELNKNDRKGSLMNVRTALGEKKKKSTV